MKMIGLNNGYSIPEIGLGTWKLEGLNGEQVIQQAIELGYCHIDTAEMYYNEEMVGNAIKKCGIQRGNIFITSKLHNEVRGYKQTIEAVYDTLRKLQIDYLDLFLIHWPKPRKYIQNYEELNIESWKALEEIVQKGYIRTIGCSNFLEHHLEPLLKEAAITPAVNQIEYHPYYVQENIVEYCKKKGIVVEAWSPIGNGRCIGDSRLINIAQKYNRSVAQICIKYVQQKGLLPIVKASTKEHLLEDISTKEFVLENEDLEIIDMFDNCIRVGRHPDE